MDVQNADHYDKYLLECAVEQKKEHTRKQYMGHKYCSIEESPRVYVSIVGTIPPDRCSFTLQ